MPVTLFALVAASAILIMLYNTGQRITEKTQAVNAADAATYSGAVWTARHLNFMAYSNRAMIANHVAVGHMVSYTSWVRYVDNVVNNTALTALSVVIPPIATVQQALGQVTGTAKSLVERSAATYLPVIDVAHQTYFSAQRDARLSLANNAVQGLMRTVTRQYRRDYRLNDPAFAAALPSQLGQAMRRALRGSAGRRANLVDTLALGDRGGQLRDLVSRTWARNEDLERFIAGNRGWDPIGIPLVLQFRKQGKTEQITTSSDMDWQAEDALQQRTWNPLKLSWNDWSDLAAGEASADGLTASGEYRGMPGYQGLSPDPVSGAVRNRVSLPFVALVSTSAAAAEPKSITPPVASGNAPAGPFGNPDNANTPGGSGPFTIGRFGAPITAAGVSETYFKRPVACDAPGADSSRCVEGLAAGTTTRPNLFNPFWRARRLDFTFLCNQRALIGAPVCS